MRNIETITKPYQGLTYLSAKVPSIIITLPLVPENNSSLYELIPQLRISPIIFKYILIPQVNKNFKN